MRDRFDSGWRRGGLPCPAAGSDGTRATACLWWDLRAGAVQRRAVSAAARSALAWRTQRRRCGCCGWGGDILVHLLKTHQERKSCWRNAPLPMQAVEKILR